MSLHSETPSWMDTLREAVGEDAVEEHPERYVDGRAFAAAIHPSDGDALAATLSLLSAKRAAAVICGGGTRLRLGNPPQGAELLLCTGRLVGVDQFDSSDGVVHVLAGTPLSQLRTEVGTEGWEVALDPWGSECSVGGVLSAAAFGPRRQGYGAPRDSVLGLDVALATGERTRCGGRVVKNVTGYDLAKLYTGALGSLGVIEGAWLRLRRRPEVVRVYRAPLAANPSPRDAFACGLELARRPTSRAAALLSAPMAAQLPVAATGPAPQEAAWHCLVELAGDEPAVVRDAKWLESHPQLKAPRALQAPADEASIDALRALQAGVEAPVRARLAALPSKLAGVLEALEAAHLNVDMLVYPGVGLAYLQPRQGGKERTASEDGEAERTALRELLDRLEVIARGAGAQLLLEQLPTWAKEERDVFGSNDQAVPLMRALKQRFDPARILNPGRVHGRL